MSIIFLSIYPAVFHLTALCLLNTYINSKVFTKKISSEAIFIVKNKKNKITCASISKIIDLESDS